MLGTLYLGKTFAITTVVAAEEVAKGEECTVAESPLVQNKMENIVKLLTFRPCTDKLHSGVLQATHETPFLRLVDFISTEVFFHVTAIEVNR